jgi:glycosyltransferase involved in cell wall biosynthesis
VIRALSTHFPAEQYHLYTPRNPPQAETADILNRKNVHVVTPGMWYQRLHATSIWRTWGISKEPSVQKLDIFHGLSQELPVNLPSKVRKVITVHALIFYRYPQFYNSIDVAIYKKKLEHACEKADTIIAISQQTKADLEEFLNISPSRIRIVYQGSHPNFKARLTGDEINTVSKRHDIPDNYILSVGTIERRKNLLIVIKALARLPKTLRPSLVILGRPTEYFKEVMEAARELHVDDSVFVPQNVPFHDFPAIYQKAKIFIYPSLFEGFGIPLIEAIESRVPVITSVGSCFSEAAGPSSIFVDPHDEVQLADRIQAVLGDTALANSMVHGSYEYIQRFEPATIAEQIMDVYKHVN